MRFYLFRNWLLKQVKLSRRLQEICLWYIISLMIITRKHSLDHAASISGKSRSQFSRFLGNHRDTALLTLKDLSRKEAKKCSRALRKLEGLPWKAAVLIDLTDQRRSSLHPQNAKKLNHGKGYFIGHQWTNIVLLVGERLIPLPPIPFWSRKYCEEKKILYKTEHERVIEYLRALDLGDYLESYRPSEVVVLADSGYDDKDIQNAILDKGWDFLMALKHTRSVKSVSREARTSPSTGWSQIEDFFKAHRRLKWETVRLFIAAGLKRKRKEFRIRHTLAWLKSVGPVQLVCSEKRKAPEGERKYIACTDLTLKARQILIGYRLRWSVEIFHKAIKMHLGFEDVSTTSFDSVTSHVHWVYCAYILLTARMPGCSSPARGLFERQRHVMEVLEHKEKAHLLQKLTQIRGLERHKTQLKEALAA